MEMQLAIINTYLPSIRLGRAQEPTAYELSLAGHDPATKIHLRRSGRIIAYRAATRPEQPQAHHNRELRAL
jgi:hypothetical protein